MTSEPRAAEILDACLATNTPAAWAAFVKRFQPLVAASVARVASRYGVASPALVDDLCQETYLKLCRDNCRALRSFEAQHDDAIFGYLKVIATSVALDHFRAIATHKRRGEVQEEDFEAQAPAGPSNIELDVLLKELEQMLTNSQTERDCNIFWLYYRQGYTTKDIAGMPQIGLTQKGVESCIYRLTQMLRNAVTRSSAAVNQPEKGFSGTGTLGVVK